MWWIRTRRSLWWTGVAGLAAVAGAAPPAAGQDGAAARDGLYLGLELGVAIGPALSVTGSDNDWSTLCDKIINPMELETGDSCAAAPPLTEWSNDLDGGTGILAGLALGTRMGALRLEGAYAFRGTTYDQIVPTRIGDAVTRQKEDEEIEVADGGAGNVLSHEFFANLYYDFTPNARFTPYVGVGAGMALAGIDYYSRWKRNDDPEQIKTFQDPGLRNKIAGTTTIGWGKLSDTVLGTQGLAGLDYRVDDRVTLGLKLRWTIFAEFASEQEWIQLRSHESDVGRGFRVLYTAKSRDLGGAALAITMRYRL